MTSVALGTANSEDYLGNVGYSELRQCGGFLPNQSTFFPNSL